MLVARLGGDDRARTGDLLRAREALSQLSYVPVPHRLRCSQAVRAPVPPGSCHTRRPGTPDPLAQWWAIVDLNHGPRPYQGRALTS
jgi:hypothetical protein